MRELTNCSPEAIAMRARATYTRAEIVTPKGPGRAYTTFYAVYTTPEGEVADRIYCYSDSICGDRRSELIKNDPGFYNYKLSQGVATAGEINSP